LHALIDSPLNGRGMARLVEATVSAITAHEKRIRVQRVQVDVTPGTVVFDITGQVRGSSANLSVEVPR
jgi:phage baseplate assembly protein W